MAQKVARVGIKKEPGWLYFVDKKGDISRAEMARAGRKRVRVKKEKVAKVGIKKEEGWLYFVDKDGDISRVKMARGRKRKRRR
ncbi:hypothetical protein J7K74_02935 [Candidatus Woesearchaeota archaeon]|nr:hypothetical protein [Candidatus Woesearchaeota archaeon]